MGSDFETLAKAFLNGKRPQNIDALKSILSTPESKKTLCSIMSDGGGAVKQAVSQAQKGNVSEAQSLVERIMKTPDGAELVSKIVKAVEQQK